MTPKTPTKHPKLWFFKEAEIFGYRRPIDFLITIHNNGIKHLNVSAIARESDMTYSHASTITKQLEDLGLVYSSESKSKREKILKLTPKGKHIAECLVKINTVMSQNSSLTRFKEGTID